MNILLRKRWQNNSWMGVTKWQFGGSIRYRFYSHFLSKPLILWFHLGSIFVPASARSKRCSIFNEFWIIILLRKRWQNNSWMGVTKWPFGGSIRYRFYSLFLSKPLIFWFRLGSIFVSASARSDHCWQILYFFANLNKIFKILFDNWSLSILFKFN